MPTPLNQTLIGGDEDDILYGVCEVTDAFGEVESCELGDECDEQEFTNCRGNTRLVLLKNERYEMELEVIFDALIGLPARGASVAFPTVGVTGQYIRGRIIWSKEDRVKMRMTCKHWKELGSTPVVTALEEPDPIP